MTPSLGDSKELQHADNGSKADCRVCLGQRSPTCSSLAPKLWGAANCDINKTPLLKSLKEIRFFPLNVSVLMNPMKNYYMLPTCATSPQLGGIQRWHLTSTLSRLLLSVRFKHPTEEDLHLTSISGTNRNNISKYSPIQLFLNALLLRVDRTTLVWKKDCCPLAEIWI